MHCTFQSNFFQRKKSEVLFKLMDDMISNNILVIVEGIKDKRALAEFGVINVKILNKPLYAIVEEVAAKEKKCVVLTDLDEEGKKLYSRLAKDLKKFGVKVDDKLRNYLFKETSLRQIEGLGSYNDRHK